MNLLPKILLHHGSKIVHSIR